ncbi:MAG TPA: cholesterol oxidase substrate-binding domain-containing protein [Cellvibrio sp.]|nr:cholesterol oxidase substrate-binding domain-containing protein [Cellvibrio sp.]
MNQVQKITVINKGAYIFNFSVQWLEASGKWITSKWNSGNYLLGSSCTTPLLNEIGVPADAVAIAVFGHAEAGSSGQGVPFVSYAANDCTAVYEAVGSPYIGFAINFVKVVAPVLPPPDFPKIPLSRQPYLNWALDIDVAEVWVCEPASTDDVLLVCNWAKQYGYKVRPMGIKHNWSPLTVVKGTPADAKVILLDTTKSFNKIRFIPGVDGAVPRVRVGTGATMDDLLTALENQPGGKGAAPGYSFPHTPAPGHITVGGALAINAHGTAIRTLPNDNFSASYGSISNQILAFTAVVTDPQSAYPDQYCLRRFTRGEGDASAFLTQLGRAFIVEAELQVIDNYNLRCESSMDLPWQTLFQKPAGSSAPKNSFAEFMNRCGRIEIIWFPFSANPWLHLWTVAPEKPATSREVHEPYNYPFADNLPEAVTSLLKKAFGASGYLSSFTPEFGKLMALVTKEGLAMSSSTDIWGASKNTLLYVKDTTLRVTANGYAIHLKRDDVQAAVHDIAFKFNDMLTAYGNNGDYPINSPMEIRLTNLDDSQHVGVAPGVNAGVPVISSLSQDAMDVDNQWDVALWVDMLTLPDTPKSNQFYRELEDWLLQRFSGNAGKLMPEWSKAWAYTDANGPWTNSAFLEHIRQAFSIGRDDNNNWTFERDTLKKYDRYNLFSNEFLDKLFSDS